MKRGAAGPAAGRRFGRSADFERHAPQRNPLLGGRCIVKGEQRARRFGGARHLGEATTQKQAEDAQQHRGDSSE
ncbi:MAG: hypothetical protein QM775_28995 [Pirellulales bacterium]